MYPYGGLIGLQLSTNISCFGRTLRIMQFCISKFLLQCSVFLSSSNSLVSCTFSASFSTRRASISLSSLLECGSFCSSIVEVSLHSCICSSIEFTIAVTESAAVETNLLRKCSTVTSKLEPTKCRMR